jgi:hypothetical protein
MGKRGYGIGARWAAAAILVASVAGCGQSGYEDGAGFQDGFLAGYARDCPLRSPPGEKRWRGSAYSRGYADGIDNGIRACRGLRNGGDPAVFATAAMTRHAEHR